MKIIITCNFYRSPHGLVYCQSDLHLIIGPLYNREFLAKYAKFRQQIWAVRQSINPRDKNQKQANFCSQVVVELRTPYSIKALWIIVSVLHVSVQHVSVRHVYVRHVSINYL